MSRGAALAALADPTRRRIYERLVRGPRSVGELARALPISQPAVSQHLRTLREAGLVQVRPEGVRRIYAADQAGLAELRAYLDSLWQDVLGAFAAFADQEAAREEESGPPGARLRGGGARSREGVRSARTRG